MDPAAIIAPSPIVTPLRIVTEEAIHTSLPMVIFPCEEGISRVKYLSFLLKKRSLNGKVETHSTGWMPPVITVTFSAIEQNLPISRSTTFP